MPLNVCATAFSVSTASRVLKGEANETAVCWVTHSPVCACMAWSNGTGHLRSMECADAGDLPSSSDQLLAGAGIIFAEPSAVRQIYRLVGSSPQSPLRPWLE